MNKNIVNISTNSNEYIEELVKKFNMSFDFVPEKFRDNIINFSNKKNYKTRNPRHYNN